jgi:hypothetical protein
MAAVSLAPRPATPFTIDGRRFHVAGGRLTDHQNRELTLRGVNARVRGVFDVTFTDGRLPLELFVPPRRYPRGITLRCDGGPIGAKPDPVAGVITTRCGRGHGEHVVELAPVP